MMIARRIPSSKHVVSHQEKSPNSPTTRACRSNPFAMMSQHTMPDVTIHTVGIILENPQPVLYRVSLPNGKIILAHLSKGLVESNARFTADQQVVIELTPYDFDQARILRAVE
jgi:translation initiation factor IF-1